MKYDSVPDFECEWGGPDAGNYAVDVSFDSDTCFLKVYQPRKDDIYDIEIGCLCPDSMTDWLKKSAEIIAEKFWVMVVPLPTVKSILKDEP
jgi:hypothetical protein